MIFHIAAPNFVRFESDRVPASKFCSFLAVLGLVSIHLLQIVALMELFKTERGILVLLRLLLLHMAYFLVKVFIIHAGDPPILNLSFSVFISACVFGESGYVFWMT